MGGHLCVQADDISGEHGPHLDPALAVARAVAFADVPGWAADDHLALLTVFQGSCDAPSPLRAGMPQPPALSLACEASRQVKPEAGQARIFFEQAFTPYKITPKAGEGFLTGYFEPEFPGSLTRTDAYSVPLYGRPPEVVTRLPGDAWPGLDPALSAAHQTPDGLKPFFERDAIEQGALAGRGLEIIWLRDTVDRFVMQVQGSGRVRLEDGRVKRLAYSGRNGHPYSSLGRILVEELGIAPALMTMDRLVAHLKADPVEATRLIAKNRSFVFFRLADELDARLGPIGGAGVPLTALRSVAADRSIWPYGTPVVLSGHLPRPGGEIDAMARAAIIQDTGSAILGPARIDLFFGSGPEAGHLAGLVRHPMMLFVLWPKAFRLSTNTAAGHHAPPP